MFDDGPDFIFQKERKGIYETHSTIKRRQKRNTCEIYREIWIFGVHRARDFQFKKHVE